MNSGLLSILCLCLAIPIVSGLSCIVCSGLSLNGGTDACVDHVRGSTANAKNCTGTLAAGNAFMCAVIAREYSTSDDELYSVERGCIKIAKDTAQSCGESSGEYNNVTATKTVCYCNTDNCNGQTTLAPVIITSLVGLALYAVL